MQSFTKKRRKLPTILVLLTMTAAALAAWFALRIGPEPAVTLETAWPAIGRATEVIATFNGPEQDPPRAAAGRTHRAPRRAELRAGLGAARVPRRRRGDRRGHSPGDCRHRDLSVA
jgi:hypothetical protein